MFCKFGMAERNYLPIFIDFMYSFIIYIPARKRGVTDILPILELLHIFISWCPFYTCKKYWWQWTMITRQWQWMMITKQTKSPACKCKQLQISMQEWRKSQLNMQERRKSHFSQALGPLVLDGIWQNGHQYSTVLFFTQNTNCNLKSL